MPLPRGACAMLTRTEPTECRHDAGRSRRHRSRCARGRARVRGRGRQRRRCRHRGVPGRHVHRARASSASWAAPSSTCGRVGEDPVVIDGNVEMPGRGPDAVGLRPRRARGPHRLRRRRDDRGRTRLGRQLRCGASTFARQRPFRPAPVASPRRAVGADLPRGLPRSARPRPSISASSATRLFGDDPEAHALVTGADGGRARAGRDLDERRPRRHPRAACGAGRLALHHRAPSGGCSSTTMAAQRRPHHRGRPRGVRAGRARPRRCGPSATGRGAQPAALRRRPDARGDARRAGAARADWTWADVIDIQRRVLAYRLSVHDRSRDLDADGHALLAAVERHGLAGLPTSASTAHVSAVDERRATPAPSRCPPATARAWSSPAPASCSTTPSASPSSTGSACTPSRRAPGSPPTWRRRRPGATPGAALAVGLAGRRPHHDGAHAGARPGAACAARTCQHAIDAPRAARALHGRTARRASSTSRPPTIAAAVARSGLPGQRVPRPAHVLRRGRRRPARGWSSARRGRFAPRSRRRHRLLLPLIECTAFGVIRPQLPRSSAQLRGGAADTPKCCSFD